MTTLLIVSLMAYYPYFLTNYPGSEQTAMAGAFAGLADDAYANFYNPAGLAFQNSLDAGVEYNSFPLVANWHEWLAAIAVPLNQHWSAGAFGWGTLYSDSTNDMGLVTKIFEHEFTTGLTAAYQFNQNFGAGIAAKYVGSFLSEGGPGTNFGAVAFDAGLLGSYHTRLGRFRLGLALQNAGTRMQEFGSTFSDNLPVSVRAGASYTITARDMTGVGQKDLLSKYMPGAWPLPHQSVEPMPAESSQTPRWRYDLNQWLLDRWRVVVAYDMYKTIVPWDSSLSYYDPNTLGLSLGVEVRPVPFIAFRVGYFYEPGRYVFSYPDVGGLTAGVGLDLKFLRIDVSDDHAFLGYLSSYTPAGRLRVSLAANIGEPFISSEGVLRKGGGR